MSALKFTFMFLFFTLFLLGCTNSDTPGPEGPRGPAGPTGAPGKETIGLMYEVEFDLVGSNKWEAFYDFPEKDEIYKEDVVLVYLLWAQVGDQTPKTDVWRLMPVNYFSAAGIFSINYDFSVNDVRIFGDASFTKDPAKDVYRDLVARIVVVPADFSPNGRKANTVNFNDYEQVKKAFKLPDTPVTKGVPFKKVTEAVEAAKAL